MMVVTSLTAGLAAPVLAADVDQARATVQSALEDGIQTFASGKVYPLEERTRLLETILRRHSDPMLLSAAVLGRSWGRISPEDQAVFAEKLVRFLVSSYVGMLNESEAGVTFRVGEGVDLGQHARIPSEVTRSQPGAVPSPVEWEVAFDADDRPAIVDLSVDGVSLIRAMHDDFTSVLRAHGGQIEPLIEALQRKIDANDKANHAASPDTRP